LLAELEAKTLGGSSGLARIDEAVRLALQFDNRFALSFLHRIRGEILLESDPTNPAPAQEAYEIAITIAKDQGARSFELLASLSLAKLLQSTGRPAEARAVLAPALEGFSPTSEMQEIAEALALLAALAETEEVKAAEAQRQRRLHLQTAYGQATIWSKGFASDESKAAFARARALAAEVGDASERFDSYYGQFIGSLQRGELNLARETAENFLRDAENEGRVTEAVVARRCLGITRLFQGDLIGAEANLAEALRTYDPERDRDARFRFGPDTGASAAIYLALASWVMGGVEQARALSEGASARADETGHAPTRANVYHFISLYHVLRGDPENVRRTAKISLDLGREHGMALYRANGEIYLSWATRPARG
jgi:predicted ATPase